MPEVKTELPKTIKRTKRISRCIPFEERFWLQVNKDGPIHPVCGQCWIWIGTGGKYGIIESNGKQLAAHRVSWGLANGGVRPKAVICHKCDTPRCVNPNHLFLGSLSINRKDCVEKGRQARGERINTAVLTEKQVKFIRKLVSEGVKASVIYEMNIGPERPVSRVISRHTWRHIE